jgi:hypothetical protein
MDSIWSGCRRGTSVPLLMAAMRKSVDLGKVGGASLRAWPKNANADHRSPIATGGALGMEKQKKGRDGAALRFSEVYASMVKRESA